MRILRIIAGLLIPPSGHFAAGRYRRGAAWAAAIFGAELLALRIGMFPMLVLWLASVIDAGIIAPVANRVIARQLTAMLVAVVVLFAVQKSVRAFWVETFKIPSGSMIPTLQIGDHMLVDKRARKPARGELTVFRYPKNTAVDFVKRVVAVGGDTIEIKDDGTLVLNGKPVPRTHVAGPCAYEDFLEESGRWEERRCEAWDETLDGRTYRIYLDAQRGAHPFPPVTLPAGDAYYVLGDNRDNAHDSRYWGTVPPENVRGTPRMIWYARDWSRVNERIR